jgi:hypothetical protein
MPEVKHYRLFSLRPEMTAKLDFEREIRQIVWINNVFESTYDFLFCRSSLKTTI